MQGMTFQRCDQCSVSTDAWVRSSRSGFVFCNQCFNRRCDAGLEAPSAAAKCAFPGCRNVALGHHGYCGDGECAGVVGFRLDVPNVHEQITKEYGDDVGRKYDSGKPRLDLLPFDALAEVAKVMTFGANKYGDDNWRMVEPASRYESAMLRHYAAHKAGEQVDPETGMSHLAHMATNALFILARSRK